MSAARSSYGRRDHPRGRGGGIGVWMLAVIASATITAGGLHAARAFALDADGREPAMVSEPTPAPVIPSAAPTSGTVTAAASPSAQPVPKKRKARQRHESADPDRRALERLQREQLDRVVNE